VLKKRARNSDAVDVPADDPVGTMDRFTDGLKRVLAAAKHPLDKTGKATQKRKEKRDT
jgi:hypothetical protein